MIGYIWVDCPKDPENFEVIMTRTNPETGNPCEVHRALPEIGWRENEKVVPSPECLDQDYAVIMGLMTEWKGGGKKPSDALRERINKAIADNRAWMANHRGIGSRRRKVKSDDDAVD